MLLSIGKGLYTLLSLMFKLGSNGCQKLGRKNIGKRSCYYPFQVS